MSDATALQERLNELAALFDELCNRRHLEGAKEYGTFTFLGNDVIRMMIEELADTVNYCRYQAIKLLLLQEMLENDDKIKEAANATGDITVGVESFVGTGKEWETREG